MGLSPLAVVPEAVAEGAASQTTALALLQGGATDATVTASRGVLSLVGEGLGATEAAAGTTVAAAETVEGAVVIVEVVEGVALAPILIGAGAVVVVALGLGLLGWWLYSRSQSNSDVPQPPKAVEKCDSPPEEVPCFDKPDGADKDEFARQLKEQQDKLNKMSPEEYRKRRQNYSPSNRDRAAQQETRDAYEAKKVAEYYEENLAKEMGPEAAQKAAEERVAKEMKDLDATHSLDMIAGGDPSDISGLGNKSANRSIGSQWTKKGRIEKLDEAAEKAKKEGRDKLNVELKPC